MLANEDILPPKVGILDTVHLANAGPIPAKVGHIDRSAEDVAQEGDAQTIASIMLDVAFQEHTRAERPDGVAGGGRCSDDGRADPGQGRGLPEAELNDRGTTGTSGGRRRREEGGRD